MEWRLALFVALAIVIVVGYGEMVRRVYGPPPEAPPPATETAAPPEPEPGTPLEPAVGLPVAGLPEAFEEKPEPRGRDITVATPLYQCVLTTAGGRLEHFRLIGYRETVATDSPPLDLVRPGMSTRRPLEVQVLRRDVVTDASVLYESAATSLEVGAGESADVLLRGTLPSGEAIAKRLSFRGDSYAIGLEVALQTREAAEPLVGLSYVFGADGRQDMRAVALVGEDLVRTGFADEKLSAGDLRVGEVEWAGYDEQYFLSVMLPEPRPVVSVRAEPFEQLQGGDLGSLVARIERAVGAAIPPDAVGRVVGRVVPGSGGTSDVLLHVGLRSGGLSEARQHASALQRDLPRTIRESRFVVGVDARRLSMRRRGDVAVVGLFSQLLESSGTLGYRLYLGPKDVDVLAEVDPSLTQATDFGWFSFLAVPLLRLLRLCHRATGNYGADIIVLTLLIKILFAPLTHHFYKSMKKMQALQPQMKRIQEQFKDDRERLQKEIMDLYRRNRVNPLGGCLPMLLQLPVFIGLYQGLRYAIELRHEPFAAWIRDLSAPECHPWSGLDACNYVGVSGVAIPVLVLLMGASMLAQQWMTPQATVDPTQQRMMMLMPVVFTVFFISFPSGLVLYWLVNNVLTIGQQVLQNRLSR